MATKADDQSMQTELKHSASLGSLQQINRKRNITTQGVNIGKQQKQDGFSWWTCLLLDIPQDKNKGMKIPVFRKEE